MGTQSVVQKVESETKIVFRSLGHLLATGYKKAVVVLPKIVAAKPEIEGVTDAVLTAAGKGEVVPIANTAEDLGFAVLGELSSVLLTGGDAVKAKLLDAGLDVKVVGAVEALAAGAKGLTKLA